MERHSVACGGGVLEWVGVGVGLVEGEGEVVDGVGAGALGDGFAWDGVGFGVLGEGLGLTAGLNDGDPGDGLWLAVLRESAFLDPVPAVHAVSRMMERLPRACSGPMAARLAAVVWMELLLAQAPAARTVSPALLPRNTVSRLEETTESPASMLTA